MPMKYPLKKDWKIPKQRYRISLTSCSVLTFVMPEFLVTNKDTDETPSQNNLSMT